MLMRAPRRGLVDGQLAGELAAGAGAGAQAGVADELPGQSGVMGGGDHRGVVDPGGRRRRAGLLGPGLGVGVPADDVRDRGPGGGTVVADLDGGHVERVEEQPGVHPGQERVDLIGVAVQGDGGGLGDLAPLGPQERLAQLAGRGVAGRRAGAVTLQRRLAGLGMDRPVVDGLDPRGEQGVELIEAAGVVPALFGGTTGSGAGPCDLDEELVPDSPEKSFDLAASLGPARAECTSLMPSDAHERSRAASTKALPLPGVDPIGDAAGGQRRPQGRGQADSVLGEPEPVPGDRP
jgi:hypothetical protein